MLPRVLSIFSSILLVAFLGVMLASGARAETDALSVTGVIHTIDLKAKMLTVKKADHSTVTLKYNKATIMERNGKTVKVKALALQDSIKARYKVNGTALKFTVTGPKTGKVVGALANALKGTGAVTIGTTVVQTNAETRVSRNGKLVSLSQLTRQDTIVAHTKTGVFNAPMSSAAEDLIASGPDDDEVHGTITAILGNQITITPTNGTADVTVNVTGTTMLEVDGDSAALGDLAVGMQVEAHFDPATFDAFAIETDSVGAADDAHVTGTVSAVDVSAGTVTIAPANVTLTVNAATEIEVNDAHGTLEDLSVAMPIRAEYDLNTLSAKEIKAGTGDENSEDEHVEGTVTAVDTTNNTITIAPNGGGSDITLNVGTETDIEVNGANASLASVQVSMPVRAEYDPATMNAFEINAGTDDGGGGSEEDQVKGTVADVNTGDSTVTISPDGGGADITLTVTLATEIEVNGDPGTLADIQNGDAIEAKYIGATLEATEIKVGDSGGGD